MTRVINIVFVLSLFIVVTVAEAQVQPLPRNNYGAYLEPPDMVLHASGQCSAEYYSKGLTSFAEYCTAMGPNLLPSIFMYYTYVDEGRTSAINLDFSRLRDIVEDYEEQGHYLTPQVAILWPSTGLPVTGFEDEMQTIVDGMKSIGHPVFVRVGPEFNASTYSPLFEANQYKTDYCRIVDALRQGGVRAAMVWCPITTGSGDYYGSWEYIQDFYPGDSYVDWWGVDVFNAVNFTHPNTVDLVARAHQHGKPLMIGETGPKDVGVDSPADWSAWFVPFFDFIYNNPGVKAHTYINWDWSDTRWPTWGDFRIEVADPYIKDNYITEMSRSLFYHAGPLVPAWMGQCGDWGYLGADFNQDCVVEWADFGIFAGQWQKCVEPMDPMCGP